MAVFLALAGAIFYAVIWNAGIRKARVAYTDEEKQQLKMVTVVTGIITLICSLIPIIS